MRPSPDSNREAIGKDRDDRQPRVWPNDVRDDPQRLEPTDQREERTEYRVLGVVLGDDAEVDGCSAERQSRDEDRLEADRYRRRPRSRIQRAHGRQYAVDSQSVLTVR